MNSRASGVHAVEVEVKLSESLRKKGVNGAQFYTYKQRSYKNLCGHISVEIAYEAITGKTNTLDEIIKNNDTWTTVDENGNQVSPHDNTTGVGDLMTMVANTFPRGCVAVGYNGSEKYVWGSGIDYLDPPIALGKKFYDDGALKGLIMGMLNQGHYVIAGGMLNQSDGRMDTGGDTAHWLMITGICGDYVRIYNPFTNGIQYMTWSDYEASFNATEVKQLLEIYSLPSPQIETKPESPAGST